MDRLYGKIEADTKLYRVINCLDARQRITLFELDNYEDSSDNCNVDSHKNQKVNYVYDLLNSEYNDIMENYIVDYIRFDYDYITIIIKPNKYYK